MNKGRTTAGWRFSHPPAQRAVQDALSFEARIEAIQAGWRQAAKPVRRNSAADLLIGVLPGAPILYVCIQADTDHS